MKRFLPFLFLASQTMPGALAQPPFEPLKIGDVTISVSLRERIESWDWFQGGANNQYIFSGSIARIGLSQSTAKLDWQIELAAPFLLGLPDDAVAPGAQGQMGSGANYYVANSKSPNAGMVFAKQGFVRFKNLGGSEKQTLEIGRLEFQDGAEVTLKDPTLAALERDRIAQRLIGTFSFSDVGRSFDGAQYAWNSSGLNLTLLAARPTRGVYQVDGWGEVKINLFYGAITGPVRRKQNQGEWRLFGIGYQDLRDGVVKTDNRPLAVRTADAEHIAIGTYGGDYIHTAKTSAGDLDFLAWGALQGGSWGKQTQRAAAFAVEGGYQPAIVQRVKPWLRGGYNYGSGDGNPNDNIHGTFFQLLPSPRTYARTPFFNLMNNRDLFAELQLHPAKRLAIRSDVHGLGLANRNDSWYTGGGAYQPWTFGFTGRASNGHTGLANLYDVSADYGANTHFAISLYFGHIDGKAVIESIYPQGRNGNFGFVEFNVKL